MFQNQQITHRMVKTTLTKCNWGHMNHQKSYILQLSS